MNTKTRLILIVALLGISAVVLAVAFVQRGGLPAPATTPPPATDPSGTTNTAAAPGATALPGETAAPATLGVTTVTMLPGSATVETGAPADTPEPTPTLTAEELLARELVEPRGQVTYSAGECSKILEAEPWCSVIKSATPITRPEWEELFPQTDFFLVKTNLYGGEFAQQPNWLIVEQDDQRYTAETFDRLLKANGVITITDENRELVAQAFALMTIPDYLGEEIVFTEWEEGEWRSGRYLYTNYLKAWTKIQGLEIWWWFEFKGNWLKTVTKFRVVEYHIGDYIDVSFFDLPLPPTKNYRFRGE